MKRGKDEEVNGQGGKEGYKDMDRSQVIFTGESPFKLYHVPNSKSDVLWHSHEHLIHHAPPMKCITTSFGMGRNDYKTVNNTSHRS